MNKATQDAIQFRKVIFDGTCVNITAFNSRDSSPIPDLTDDPLFKGLPHIVFVHVQDTDALIKAATSMGPLVLAVITTQPERVAMELNDAAPDACVLDGSTNDEAPLRQRVYSALVDRVSSPSQAVVSL